jgi:hypothetical protein
MPGKTALAFAALLLIEAVWAAPNDPCSAVSSASDLRLTLALKDGRAIFEDGEIIPLVLSFTAPAENRHLVNARSYDRSGRLEIDRYCVEPAAPDPLETYFKGGPFILGGLQSERELGATPFIVEAELNEWRSLGPGRYRVYVISNRVGRRPNPGEQTPYYSIPEILRSNTVELQVKPPDPSWQAEQLRAATQTLSGAPSPENARRAARTLRFLNTPDSTRQLAKLFWGQNQHQPFGLDFMFGLYGSPYRKLAIDSMRDQIAAPDQPITEDFLSTLVNLEVSADPAWDSPPEEGADSEAASQFWERRQAHTKALAKVEMERVAAALALKDGHTRALTIHGLLMAGGYYPAIPPAVRPALIAAWSDLPREMQRQLILYRWPLIAGPEMLPILRRMVAGPPPPARTNEAAARDAALKHIHELDPAEGRALILRDALDPNAEPDPDVVKLLPEEDIAAVLRPALERIGHNSRRDLDYELLDRYADGNVLGVVQTVFEKRLGRWACAPQSAMLRYFLRVDPAYGARRVSASLNTRKDTRCYTNLLQSLRSELPQAQQSAIQALDDPDFELVHDAFEALRRWGSADAEAALWARLRRLHQDWAGREGQLRLVPPFENPGYRAVVLEQGLVSAIATGSNWICPPDKLAQLNGLVITKNQGQQIEIWMQKWKQEPALITPSWSFEDAPRFYVLQYESLTEDQLRVKLGQFPRGTQLMWKFWQPEREFPPVSMVLQEALYERMRTVAEKNGVTLGKANHP